ncbi:hypothetical protein GCM10007380_04980 [Gottfriedia solisilvae]|uniref:Uncharacterized protein n=1 Tax=Gottfriedia solisilvae TaxID=1516104 RepID=A0A8J3ACQ2_9BACI|nr:hypothetical protein GCM10007380_04980 [Gottfriedia solisilvae]
MSFFKPFSYLFDVLKSFGKLDHQKVSYMSASLLFYKNTYKKIKGSIHMRGSSVKLWLA